MKIDEIQVGALYFAKVNGRTARIRVISIRKYHAWPNDVRLSTRIYVYNLDTKRSTAFKSAAKIIRPIVIGAELVGEINAN